MKKIAILLISLLAAGTVLMGCSNNSDSDTVTPVEEDYDAAEYITVADYKDLPYYTETVEISDEDVEAELELMMEYATETTSVTEGVVEDGDTINIAFVGTIDGEEFENGSSESFDLTVGTTSMIDGFVEGLIGKNIGDKVTLNLTFPYEYINNPDLSGKDVVFEVTINSKRVSVVPELTDEFVKEHYEFETVDELREHIREDLVRDAEEATKATIMNNLWEVICHTSEVKSVPESLQAKVDQNIEEIEAEYKEQAEMYGMEWSEFLSTFMGADEESFKSDMEDYADEMIRDELVVKYICNAEDITLTDSEYNDKLLEILERNEMDEETFESYYGETIQEYADENGWRDSILREKVLEKILEYGKEVSKEEFDAFIAEKLPDVEVANEEEFTEGDEIEDVMEGESSEESEGAEGTDSEATEGEEETEAEG